MICADSCDGITKYYASNTVYACMEEQTEDQLTAYRRLIGHEADLVTTGDAVDINRLREKAAVLKIERDALRRKLDRVFGLMRDVRADQALLEGNWATAKETYEKQIQDLKAENNELKKTCDNLKLTMERVAETNAKTVANMSNTIADLKEKNRNLRSQVEKLEADVTTFRQSVCAVTTSKYQLQTTISELKSQAEQLQGAVAAGKDRLIKCLEQRARLQDSLEELRRENTELRCKLARFESLSIRDEKGGLL